MSLAGRPLKLHTTDTMGMFVDGKISVGIENAANAPISTIRIAMQATVYGRRSASRTIHIVYSLTLSLEPISPRSRLFSERAADERLQIGPRQLIVVPRVHVLLFRRRQILFGDRQIDHRRRADVVPTEHDAVVLPGDDEIAFGDLDLLDR